MAAENDGKDLSKTNLSFERLILKESPDWSNCNSQLEAPLSHEELIRRIMLHYRLTLPTSSLEVECCNLGTYRLVDHIFSPLVIYLVFCRRKLDL